MTPKRPASTEFDPYYNTYISKVPDGDIIEILRHQRRESLALYRAISSEKANYRYADGKWSIKEVVGHMIDTEWVFTSRALWVARGDQSALPGMDQDAFLANSNIGERDFDAMVEEYNHLRLANTTLFASFGDGVLDRAGIADKVSSTVRARIYIIAGHELHHIGVLKDRYLND